MKKKAPTKAKAKPKMKKAAPVAASAPMAAAVGPVDVESRKQFLKNELSKRNDPDLRAELDRLMAE